MPEVSQGSSLLATLGFIAESLWDSRSLASIKIRVKCRASEARRRFGLCLRRIHLKTSLSTQSGVAPRLPPHSIESRGMGHDRQF